MATTLLAAGTAELQSSPVVLGAGTNAVVFLTTGPDNVPVGAGASIQFQQADNTWINVYMLRAPDMLTALIPGPVTFRVARRAGYSAVLGVDMG